MPSPVPAVGCPVPAVDELTRGRSAMSLEAANREVYRLIKEGLPVSVPDRVHGGQKAERLRKDRKSKATFYALRGAFYAAGYAVKRPAHMPRVPLVRRSGARRR